MYRIGEMAARCGLKTDTLRFYEKSGLLVPSARNEAGYRLYNQNDEAKLHFILRAKSVGFSLDDIAELLSIRLESEEHSCAEPKLITDTKLAQVEAKIRELEIFRSSLQKLSDSCCGGAEPASHCSILEALAASDKEALC
ncbi:MULTISPECIES: Zn(2+)-responsive transcriptional regulator [unclassified Motilimonas]|uniref:Zn(2+)-responsive transcriptional regulator n=1 Tax=Motilimonas TaxID=1914248 RepID=UPI001E604723|nr:MULTISPECIES: Zn(2+)-responsive transcriptional regulator [unclassified Motilimonas]MCE0555651.1 Zn(2+)-responsive transcriptional regulator [Motilimonas sp. E26]MDO6526685.1 Zn(2+)-responsive transcriptional regulator [Motilimonas sp. 1_MG-2023]